MYLWHFYYFFGFAVVIKIVVAQNRFIDIKTSRGNTLENRQHGQTRVTKEKSNNTLNIAKTIIEKFEFEKVPENADVDFGSSYAMFCKTTRPDAEIIWLKDHTVLEGETPFPNLKYLNKNTLWIKSMDYRLSGMYYCLATLPTDAITVQANIRVKSKQDNSSCSSILTKTPKSSSFIEGEFAYLECLSMNSNIHIFWEKNGIALQYTDDILLMQKGYLFFKNINLEDEGIYTCFGKVPSLNCTKKASALLKINSKPKVEEICGRVRAKEALENSDFKRLIGGRRTKKGAYPWQVLMTDDYPLLCTGVLLNRQWIATEAYSLYELANTKNFRWYNLKIRLGKYERHETEDHEFATFIADAASIIFHPHFNGSFFYHNIVLIRLRETIRFNDYTIPICFGEKELVERFVSSNIGNDQNRIGVVTGWGASKVNRSSATYLSEITIPIVDKSICEKSLPFEMDSAMFCAGFGELDSDNLCQGDFGAPFMVHHEDKWFLVGLASYTAGCSRQDQYAWFIKVSNYFNWIKSIIES